MSMTKHDLSSRHFQREISEFCQLRHHNDTVFGRNITEPHGSRLRLDSIHPSKCVGDRLGEFCLLLGTRARIGILAASIIVAKYLGLDTTTDRPVV